MCFPTSMSLIVILLCTLIAIRDSYALQCLNENGMPVPWWFIYKHNDGMKYFYFDDASNQDKLILDPKLDISKQSSALGRTLQQV